jgi:hypothetical protein
VAVQVDPIKLTLKAPGTNRLTLKTENSQSIYGFNFNLRRYSVVGDAVLNGVSAAGTAAAADAADAAADAAAAAGLGQSSKSFEATKSSSRVPGAARNEAAPATAGHTQRRQGRG